MCKPEVVLRFKQGVFAIRTSSHTRQPSHPVSWVAPKLQSITMEIELVPAPFYKLLTMRPDERHIQSRLSL